VVDFQTVQLTVVKNAAYVEFSTCLLPDHAGCDQCTAPSSTLSPWRRRWLRLRWSLHEPGNRLRIAWTALRHGEDAVHVDCDAYDL